MSSFERLAITPMIQEDSEELVQLFNPEQKSDLKPKDIPGDVLILRITNTVLSPSVVIPLTVTRQESIRLIKESYQGNRMIGVVAQKNKLVEDPAVEDIYRYGTVARILKMLVLPDGN